MDAESETECARSAFKSLVWKHFGFVKSDKSKVICLHCKGVRKYAGRKLLFSSMEVLLYNLIKHSKSVQSKYRNTVLYRLSGIPIVS